MGPSSALSASTLSASLAFASALPFSSSSALGLASSFAPTLLGKMARPAAIAAVPLP